MPTITSARLRLMSVHLTTPLNFAVYDAFQCSISGQQDVPKKENITSEFLTTASRGVLLATIESNASF